MVTAAVAMGVAGLVDATDSGSGMPAILIRSSSSESSFSVLLSDSSSDSAWRASI